MKIYTEETIRYFKFWCGAEDTARTIDTLNVWDEVEAELEELYPDGMSDTELNDMFWFDSDFIAELAGYEDYETMMKEAQIARATK